MRRATALVLVAALAYPAIASAQEAATQTTTQTGATMASTELDSVDELTTHMGLSTSATVDMAGVDASTTITVVKLSTLEASASGNTDAFKAATTTNASALTTLRDAVRANAAIVAKLTAEGLTTDDVVAVVRNDASITVYVDDSA